MLKQVFQETGESDVAMVSIVDTNMIKHTVNTTVEETSGIFVAAAMAVTTDRENSVKITDTLRNIRKDVVSFTAQIVNLSLPILY